MRRQELTVSRAYAKHHVTFVSGGRSMGVPIAAVEHALGEAVNNRRVFFRVIAKSDRLHVTLVLKPSFDPQCAQKPLAAWKVNAAGRRLYISFEGIAKAMRLRAADIANGQLEFKVEGKDILVPFPRKFVYEET